MMWNEMFGPDTTPNAENIKTFIQSDLWDELRAFIEDTYKVSASIEYSQCSAQPGWNVKYKKSSRSLCTLYPMKDFFIALIIIGNKEQNETELILPTLSKYLQDLYAKTVFSCGGRWLMIEVREEAVLEDVKKLIGVRTQKRK